MGRTFEDPMTPFVCFMDTEWIQKISIKGTAPSGASRFTIYLQNGEESEPDEIAFVVDFRFNYNQDTRTVVANHKKDGAWNTEEIPGCAFPLNEGELFKIKITVEDDMFQVKVNGNHLMEYEQRLSCRTINCLRIDNDISLHKVKME